MKKTILITGGAGFIGSNFIPYFLKTYPHYSLVNLDKLTYAGDLENLNEIKNNPNYQFVKGDICNNSLVEEIFIKNDIYGIIHFAAESHVDNSIQNPNTFVQTNINGTFNLIDTAKKIWNQKRDFETRRFLHISTDEVYGSLGSFGLFTEETPYAPNSPYSASKASSDLIVRSYHKTYGLNTVITNCSNNYGPKQHAEKLIPTIIRTALNGDPIPIYGDGKNIRDWLYVLDHCRGIDLAFHKGISGRVYNIGGKNEKDNLSIAKEICKILDQLKAKKQGSYQDQIAFTKDRLGHDRRYAIDASRIENELGWNPRENFKTGIEKTILWYLDNRQVFT